MILTWFVPDPLPPTGFAAAPLGRRIEWFSPQGRVGYAWLSVVESAVVQIAALPARSYAWLGHAKGEMDLVASVLSGAGGLGASFEAVARNLAAYPYTAVRGVGGAIEALVYTTPSGVITKSFVRVGGKITSVVLAGAVPAGIATVKTLRRDGAGQWVGADYGVGV
jgi:hypothetical protein